MDGITKKLVRDYIYYTETFDDVLKISESAEQVFREALKELDPIALQALAAPVLAEGEIPPKRIEDIEEVHFEDKDFKKIFRKIAIKCHPDKLNDSYSEREKSFLKECYNNLNKSNSTYDWGLLLKVAVELDVEVEELTAEQLNNIQENINKVREKILKYEESMAYKWYLLPDDENKKGYLEQCANIFKNSINTNPSA